MNDGTVRRRVRRSSRGRQQGTRSSVGRLPRMSPVSRRWLFAGAAGAAVAVLLGGVWGPVLGLAAALGVERVLRREGASAAEDDDRLVRSLPLACDLLA